MSQPPRGPISCPSCHDLSLFLVHRRNFQGVAVQPGLDRSATHAVVDFVCRPISSSDPILTDTRNDSALQLDNLVHQIKLLDATTAEGNPKDTGKDWPN